MSGYKSDEKDSDYIPSDYDEGEDEIKYVKQFFTILPPPNDELRTLEDLHKLVHNGNISLEAPYQRQDVWPLQKKEALIDSIFRDFPIPPLIFAEVQDSEEGFWTWQCVDGKQRLTAITKFIDGLIPCNITNPGKGKREKYWFTCGNKTRKELPLLLKEAFIRKEIRCIEYSGLTFWDEREVFQRVQMGVPLTAAEKLQAVSSPIANWVGDLVQAFTPNNEHGLSQYIQWDISRGRGFQNFAQLCFCCWYLPSFNVPTLAKLGKWLAASQRPPVTFKNNVEAMLKSLRNISCDANYYQAFTDIKQLLAPIEFVFIGILLVKMRNCPLGEMAHNILKLRQCVRSKHMDIRSNTPVIKTLWDFVLSVEIDEREPFEGWDAPGVIRGRVPRNRASIKRKRVDSKRGTEERPRRSLRFAYSIEYINQ